MWLFSRPEPHSQLISPGKAKIGESVLMMEEMRVVSWRGELPGSRCTWVKEWEEIGKFAWQEPGGMITVWGRWKGVVWGPLVSEIEDEKFVT